MTSFTKLSPILRFLKNGNLKVWFERDRTTISTLYKFVAETYKDTTFSFDKCEPSIYTTGYLSTICKTTFSIRIIRSIRKKHFKKNPNFLDSNHVLNYILTLHRMRTMWQHDNILTWIGCWVLSVTSHNLWMSFRFLTCDRFKLYLIEQVALKIDITRYFKGLPSRCV